jgi:hypothetical protein
MKKIIGNKKYRVISTDILVHLDYGYGDFAVIETVFKVQVKKSFLWITIKEFGETDEDDVEFCKREAVELYNKIVNPYG